MKSKEKNFQAKQAQINSQKKFLPAIFSTVFLTLFFLLVTLPVSAHCDSYDGPTIKDAYKALETNNVSLVLKWIDEDQEEEITSLFNKTYSLRDGDREVYEIVEKHFLETLVRLHRQTEGAAYTGLKPAGTTKKIIQLSDQAIENEDIDALLVMLNNHIGAVLKEKYHKVSELYEVKDQSTLQGREYVAAYVDYTHTLEAIHDIIEHGGEQHNH